MAVCICKPRYVIVGPISYLTKTKKTICKIADYVPNSLIPEVDGCGDYIRLRINEDDMINWFEEPDFFDFMEDSEVVEKIDVHIKEEIYTVYQSRVHL